MNKKYFDTRKDSLEDKINTIASEQAAISKPVSDVKLSVEKKYFESKKGSLEDVASKLVESKLDPVNKDAVKKKFDNRQDKDIDNDGDTDSTDKYLHKRRAAISKNIKEEQEASCGCGPECDHCKGKHSMKEVGQECDCCGNKIKAVKKEAVDNPYAVGMAQAMKSKNDKPPLEKSTITKAHDIAKSIMKKEETCPKCGKDHADKINASNCMGESKKTFSDLRTETKLVRLGNNGKTDTGQKAAVIDLEPSAKPI